MNEFQLDKHFIISSFNRAATSYDNMAELQREIGAQLLSRLDGIRFSPETILDLGCSTGFFSEKLRTQFPHATVISLDIAYHMLFQAKPRNDHLICADCEKIPLADNSVNFIFSNFLLHWCDNPETAFKEIQRVLTPDGLILFSIPGPKTLFELRHAWETVDTNNHVNAFYDMHDLGDALIRSKLADPVMDVEEIIVTYDDAQSIMKELKLLGAINTTAGRSRGLTTPSTLKKVISVYEEFRTKDGLLPVTYEVIYGHAWGSDFKKSTIKGIEVHHGN